MQYVGQKERDRSNIRILFNMQIVHTATTQTVHTATTQTVHTATTQTDFTIKTK